MTQIIAEKDTEKEHEELVLNQEEENLIASVLNKPLPQMEDYFYEKPLPKELPPVPARLSLEEDYPNRTISHPEDITNQETRHRIRVLSNQWYFDEFHGIYRQNVPGLQNSIQSKRSSIVSNQTSSFVLSSSSASLSSLTESWPAPTSIDQVHQMRKKARALRDRKKQLSLCRTMMDAACQGETSFIESPIPGTPPVNTRYTPKELRKKKKKDLFLDQVLVLEAQKMLKKLALGNGGIGLGTDGEAQFLLANCYGVGGLGLTLDRERAFALYLHASKQNHLESIYRVGCCYEIGVGTRQDHQRALQFYKKAATQSHTASMYKLAIIYMLGYCGQSVNMKESLTWLQRAVSTSNAQTPHALYCLALFQLNIKQFKQESLVYDPTYALELLFESANHFNYAPSQIKLGELYEVGNLVPVDDASSIYWYTRAASQGNADAALALSCWYLTGSDGILAQSDREAYLWARKAASYQHADRWSLAKANYLVGCYVDKKIGISENSTENAKVWYKRAAALGHLGALELLNQL
jgi:TPR repeat protein